MEKYLQILLTLGISIGFASPALAALYPLLGDLAKMLKEAWNWLRSKREAVMVVAEFKGRQSEATNPLYDALTKYLPGDKVSLECIGIIHEANGVSTPTYRVIPGEPFDYYWQGHKINISVDKYVSEKFINTKIILKAMSNKVLKDFLLFVDGKSKNVDEGVWINDYIWGYGSEEYMVKAYPTLENLFLAEETREVLERELKTFMEGEDFYRAHSLPWKKSFLFHGPPGCGKTSAAYAIAHYCGKRIQAISMTCKRPRDAFLQVKPGTVVLIDEVDIGLESKPLRILKVPISEVGEFTGEVDGTTLTLVEHSCYTFEVTTNIPERWHKYITSTSIASEKMSILMKFLDGIHLHDNIIIMTTNNIDQLPEQVRRGGRSDVDIEFARAGPQEVAAMFKSYYPDTDLAGDIAKAMGATTIAQADILHGVILGHSDNPYAALGALEALVAKKAY